MSYIQTLGQQAKRACHSLRVASTAQKNQLLAAIADALLTHAAHIIEQNQLDLANAAKNQMSAAMQDRLMLNQARIADMATAVQGLIDLPDPIGQVIRGFTLPNGLVVNQTRVPLGVVGIIFESRPNVTVDAAAICLKTGNACVLRGGKEAIHSNKALTDIMRGALHACGMDENCICLVEDTSREAVGELMHLNDCLDVLIPRGGAGLIQAVKNGATVPVIETGAGICHVYVDKDADLSMAVSILHNAKTSRPSVCNAVECVLVHRDVANTFLPMAKQALDVANVEWFGDGAAIAILGDGVGNATDTHYATEYNDYKLNVKVVDTLQQAIEHIDRFSTGHSETIVTNNYQAAQAFTKAVDSACVYVNASTRFTDGGMFGFGAEIGISTQKLHARGPMGLVEMTGSKYIIQGQGQIR